MIKDYDEFRFLVRRLEARCLVNAWRQSVIVPGETTLRRDVVSALYADELSDYRACTQWSHATFAGGGGRGRRVRNVVGLRVRATLQRSRSRRYPAVTVLTSVVYFHS